jgi:hypothetical protein
LGQENGGQRTVKDNCPKKSLDKLLTKPYARVLALPARADTSVRTQPTKKGKLVTDTNWEQVVTTDGTHHFNKEYRNGDLGFIDPDVLQPGTIWNWAYSDSANQVLTFGSEDNVELAKNECDKFASTFEGNV